MCFLNKVKNHLHFFTKTHLCSSAAFLELTAATLEKLQKWKKLCHSTQHHCLAKNPNSCVLIQSNLESHLERISSRSWQGKKTLIGSSLQSCSLTQFQLLWMLLFGELKRPCHRHLTCWSKLTGSISTVQGTQVFSALRRQKKLWWRSWFVKVAWSSGKAFLKVVNTPLKSERSLFTLNSRLRWLRMWLKVLQTFVWKAQKTLGKHVSSPQKTQNKGFFYLWDCIFKASELKMIQIFL